MSAPSSRSTSGTPSSWPGSTDRSGEPAVRGAGGAGSLRCGRWRRPVPRPPRPRSPRGDRPVRPRWASGPTAGQVPPRPRPGSSRVMGRVRRARFAGGAPARPLHLRRSARTARALTTMRTAVPSPTNMRFLSPRRSGPLGRGNLRPEPTCVPVPVNAADASPVCPERQPPHLGTARSQLDVRVQAGERSAGAGGCRAPARGRGTRRSAATRFCPFLRRCTVDRTAGEKGRIQVHGNRIRGQKGVRFASVPGRTGRPSVTSSARHPTGPTRPGFPGTGTPTMEESA